MPIRALYFPYAERSPNQALLTACVYFDRIYFLERNYFQRPTLSGVRQAIEDPEFQKLVAAGILSPIGATLFGFEYPGQARIMSDARTNEALKASVELDLTNPQLREFCSNRGLQYWSIPTGQQLYWNGLGLLLERWKEASESTGRILTNRVSTYREFISRTVSERVRVDPEIVKRAPSSGDELLVEVPFLEAQSLMTSVALLACERLNLSPLTDESIHLEFLKHKLADVRLRERFQMAGVAEGAFEQYAIAEPALKNSWVGLESLTADSVIKIRQRHKKALIRFRESIGALQKKVVSSIWEPSFDNEISQLVRTQIEPAVSTLREGLARESLELGFRLADNALKMSPLPLVATAFTGMPFELTLAASGGLVALKEAIEYRTKVGVLQRNGLAFLANAPS